MNTSSVNKKAPKISVIIPLYNHEKFIKEAILSVLEQSFSNFELIIINDGSTDNSEEIVKSIKDDRINYSYQENQGAPHTLNRGIQMARGEYISILNSDDVYYSNRLEEFLHILEANNTTFATFSRIENIDEKGKIIGFIGKEENWLNHHPDTSFKDENDIILDLLAGNFLRTTSNLFCRRTVFDNVGYFSNFKYAHDYDFFLRLCFHRKVCLVDKYLLKYRTHSANTIKENEAMANFEVALLLTNFLLKHDIKDVIKFRGSNFERALKFFNSINTRNTDKIIMTLLLLEGMHMNNDIINQLVEDSENPFRKACIHTIKSQMKLQIYLQDNKQYIKELKQYSKDIQQYSENLQNVLRDRDRELEKTRKKLDGAVEKIKELDIELEDANKLVRILLNSRSYRLGRVLTWPLRKLLH